MAYQDQFYTVGTVTVTNGSTSVTGAGTGWETALIVGGVFYAGGGAYPIQSVSSETELTLAIPYTGVDAAGTVYAIDRQRAAAISNIAMNDRLAQIIREISIGNIEDLNALDSVSNLIALANLSMVADKLIYGSGNGQFSLTDFSSAARALLNVSGGAAADRLPYFTGADTAGLTPITAFARSLLDDPNPASMAVTLGNVWNLLGNGYCKLSFGIYLMWGATSSANWDYRIYFPTAFPNYCAYANMINVYDYGGASNTYMAASTSNVDKTGFDARCRVIQNGGLVGPQTNLPIRWFAIGW